jgi:2,3-bisphosphoglycerate-dependent phosphoglycerate mutase
MHCRSYTTNSPTNQSINSVLFILGSRQMHTLTHNPVLMHRESEVAPAILAGRRVLIAAHGNSIRAICKHLDQIPDDLITGLEIPTGIPLAYTLDANLRPLKDKDSAGLLSAKFVGDPEQVRGTIGQPHIRDCT